MATRRKSVGRGARDLLRADARRAGVRRPRRTRACAGATAATASSARRRPSRRTTAGRGTARSTSRSSASRPPTPSTGSARCSSTTAGRAATACRPRATPTRAACSTRSTTASTSSPSTRAARARASRAIDCKANQETDGIYSKPFPTPLDIDVRAFARKSERYVQRCVQPEPRHLPVRLDRQRRARHGPAARGRRRRQAHLPRLLLRHLPRRHVREPVPEPPPRARARRRDRPAAVHGPPGGQPERADLGIRAQHRALPAGVRERQGDLPVRRRRPVGRLRPADRGGGRAPDPGRPTPRTVRSTATTSATGRS